MQVEIVLANHDTMRQTDFHNSPDSVQKWIEGNSSSKGKVVAVHLALDLLADDAVLLGVHLVQHHPQQSSVVLAVALLANQLHKHVRHCVSERPMFQCRRACQ